ncbi:hypothetical protein B0H14DRAFT_3516346 [Mycena olivaceomarginata]|nr:hypothetical protein B0H14DRAFT_3516346 [Mycena olivaceomarginata]
MLSATAAQQLNRGSSPFTSRGGTPSDGPIHNDEDQSASSSPNVRLGPPLPAFFPGGIVARTNTVQLKTAGERALKRFKVNDETAAEYRRYLETANVEEREALSTLYLLSVNEKLEASAANQTATWEVSATLKKCIRKYAWALLLLPTIHYYAGTVEDAIIVAMTSSNVPDVPDADGPEHAVFLGRVGHEVTNGRYAMKKRIIASLTDKELENIAKLAEDLLHYTDGKVRPTLGLYMRLAFIRSHLARKHGEKEFWYKVDDELETFRKGGPGMLLSSLEVIYDDDIEEHGKPEDARIPLGDQVHSGDPKWLQRINTEASKIKRAVKKQGKKRKRVISDTGAEDEQEPEQQRGDEAPTGTNGDEVPTGTNNDDD